MALPIKDEIPAWLQGSGEHSIGEAIRYWYGISGEGRCLSIGVLQAATGWAETR